MLLCFTVSRHLMTKCWNTFNFFLQGRKQSEEFTDESEVRNILISICVALSFSYNTTWRVIGCLYRNKNTLKNVMHFYRYVNLEMHPQQHIADDRGVHTSVKHGWFLNSNKVSCLSEELWYIASLYQPSWIPEGSLSGLKGVKHSWITDSSPDPSILWLNLGMLQYTCASENHK